MAGVGLSMALGQSQTVSVPASSLYTLNYQCPAAPFADAKMVLTMTSSGDNIDVWIDAGGGNPLFYSGLGNGATITLSPYGAPADSYTIQLRSNSGKLSTAEVTTAAFQTLCKVEVQEVVTG